MTPEELQQASDHKLAMWQSGFNERTHNDILAHVEWRRREKLEQHKLNKEILKGQNDFNIKLTEIQSKNTFKTSLYMALIGISGIIIGSILQASLSAHLQAPKQENKAQLEQPLPNKNKNLYQSPVIHEQSK